MIEVAIDLSDAVDEWAVVEAVESACYQSDLHLQMKTGLKKYPGCTHWHFKRSSETGILEVTWWPKPTGSDTRRLWLSVHGNRKAGWISEVMPRLKSMIEQRLASAGSVIDQKF
ncbi:MAG: hypothetical protein AAFY73_06660 [Pseudomonadota bacterium]